MSETEELERIGAYEVVGELPGSNPALGLYLARRPASAELVSIELLRSDQPETVARFTATSERLRGLAHRRLAALLDTGEDEGRPYRVRQHLQGGTLAETLAARRLAFHEAIAVCKALCDGLAAGHRAGIVHGRLSPGQVRVSDDLAQVQITGFGHAEEEPDLAETSTLMMTRARAETLEYLAPETMNGEPADVRSDVYSAGAIFYEMLTGRPPRGRVRLPSQLNPEVPSLVDPVAIKSLADRPADRQPDAAAFGEDIGHLQDRLRLGLVSELHGLSRSTTSLLRRSTVGTSRRRVTIILVVAGIVVVLIAIAMLLGRRGGFGLGERGGGAEEPPPARAAGLAVSTAVAAVPAAVAAVPAAVAAVPASAAAVPAAAA